MKTNSERTVEGLTWAAVVIWLGFVLIAHILDYVFIVIMVLGIIFLSSAIYQRSRGWHTSLGIWVFGIWMAVFSVLETVSALVGAGTGGEGLNIDLWVYLGVALLSMGAASILRSINSTALLGLTDPVPGSTGRTGITNGPTPYIPRQVEDDLSTGWVDPYSTVANAQSNTNTGWAEQQTHQTGWTQQPTGQPPTGQPGYQTGWTQPPTGPTQAPQWGANQWQSNQWQTDTSQWQQAGQPGQWTQDPWQQQTNPQGQWSQSAGQPLGGWGQTAEAQGSYGASANYSPWQQAQPQAPRPTERPIPQASQPPQVNPSELQARIEDIIQRSRERRGTPHDEDLPY